MLLRDEVNEMTDRRSRQTRLRVLAGASLLVMLLVASCTTAGDASDDRSRVARPSGVSESLVPPGGDPTDGSPGAGLRWAGLMPDGPERYFAERFGGANVGTVTISESACSSRGDLSVTANDIKIHFLNDSGAGARFEVARLEDGSTLAELQRHLVKHRSEPYERPGFLTPIRPTLARAASDDHDIRALAGSAVSVRDGWVGIWVGRPRPVLRSGPIVVVCLRPSSGGGGAIPVGAVGPIEVVTPESVELRGDVDAMVWSEGSTCYLNVRDPVVPGPLEITFVNNSRLDAYFRIVQLSPALSVEDLRRDPGLHHPVLGKRWATATISPSAEKRWRSPQQVPAGSRWAVACWEDRVLSENGFFVAPVDVVGTILVA
jgi:hypothetical protein